MIFCQYKLEYDTLTKIKTLIVDEKKPVRYGEWGAKEIEVLNEHLFLTSKPQVSSLSLCYAITYVFAFNFVLCINIKLYVFCEKKIETFTNFIALLPSSEFDYSFAFCARPSPLKTYHAFADLFGKLK